MNTKYFQLVLYFNSYINDSINYLEMKKERNQLSNFYIPYLSL